MDAFLEQRQYDEQPQSPRDHRSPAERDRDRVLHSSAFRRLQGKTQVFGIGLADFYRTRLTHSIETAQIARGIAHNMLCEVAQHYEDAREQGLSAVCAIIVKDLDPGTAARTALEGVLR